MRKHKYVRHSIIGFILWPCSDDLYHSHVGDLSVGMARGQILSAGFAVVYDGKVTCSGKSESLRIKSRPEDSELLAKQLGLA